MRIEDAWAAGFLEGEGSFSANYRRFVIKVSQVDLEPIERLKTLYGGSYSIDNRQRSGCYSKQPQYQWFLGGAAALRLIEVIRPLLSERRCEQIDAAIAKAASWNGTRYVERETAAA